ncbi:MAG: hypothetical protein ACLP4W_30070 [Mycobacterium sp.]|uniref:hypothetical protein n=1 Tax=Mycobacterium sp. TaxID=1785 RepID=UPI003F9E9AD1
MGFLGVFGLLSKWGANQWGPLASWVAGLLAGGATGSFADIRKTIFGDVQGGIGRRPDTTAFITTWQTILAQREKHLELAQQHFSLTHKDVEEYVLQNQAP